MFRAVRMLLWIFSFWLCQGWLHKLCLRCDCFSALAGQAMLSHKEHAVAVAWVQQLCCEVLQTPKKIKCLKYQILVNIVYIKIFPYLVSFLENKLLVSFSLQGNWVNKLLFLKYFLCQQERQNKIQASLRCIQSCILGWVKSQYILCILGYKIMEKHL